MNRQMYRIIGGIVVTVLVVAAAAFGYIYVSGGSGQASAPISAPALSANNTTGTGTTQKVYRIDPAQSKVTFTLTEDLMGKPNTVVATTNQVAGDVLIDLNNPANTKVGEIRVDVRSLATDSGMRDRMIRGQILQSSQDKYEFVSFMPTAVTGLPDKLVAGQTVSFKIAGNLTVRDITKPVTFDATATLSTDSPERVTGSATTTVKRADYNLQIPNVASVANVSDDVKLAIEFVAPLSTGAAQATAAATAAQ
jgi:polyisoprenoid-binding protein YceI